MDDGAVLHSLTTVHGFRTTFRVWAGAQTDASHAAKELSVAHSVGGNVEMAYMRSDLMDQRRNLMQAWADYVHSDLGRTHTERSLVSDWQINEIGDADATVTGSGIVYVPVSMG